MTSPCAEGHHEKPHEVEGSPRVDTKHTLHGDNTPRYDDAVLSQCVKLSACRETILT